MANKLNKIIVVGAGPVGLVAALMLGKHGLSVDVVEANPTVNEAPRGLAYGPPAARYYYSFLKIFAE